MGFRGLSEQADKYTIKFTGNGWSIMLYVSTLSEVTPFFRPDFFDTPTWAKFAVYIGAGEL